MVGRSSFVLLAFALTACTTKYKASRDVASDLLDTSEYEKRYGMEVTPERFSLSLRFDGNRPSVTGVTRLTSHALSPNAKSPLASGDYRVEILDTKGAVVDTYPADFSASVGCHGTHEGQRNTAPSAEFSQSLVVEASGDRHSYRLSAPNGEVLQSGLLPAGAPAPAARYSVHVPSSSGNRMATAAAYRFTKPIRVLVLGDRFADIAAVRAASTPFIQKFYDRPSIAPYASAIHFVFGQTNFDFGCGAGGRVPYCDDGLVSASAATVPNDFVIVVLNTKLWGGVYRTGKYAVTTLADWHIFTHELGHMIFGLSDEYVDEQYYAPLTVPRGPNCVATARSGWVAGCQKGAWFRPSHNSIMRQYDDAAGDEFNTFSIERIGQRMATLTGAVLSNPAENAVRGAFLIGYGREASQADLDFWIPRILSGEHTQASLTQLFSATVRATGVVDGAFQQGYRRAATDGDRAFWVPRVMSGEHTLVSLTALFRADVENRQRQDAAEKTVRDAIRAGYNREATAADLSFWTPYVLRGETDYARMVAGFTAQVNAGNTVNAAVRVGYLREPGEPDRNYWVPRVLSGEHNYDSLVGLFTRHRTANEVIASAVRDGYGRAHTQADLDFWAQHVISGAHTYTTLVAAFRAHVWAADTVRAAFRLGLLRDAQDNDVNFWYPRLLSGEHTYASLVNLFVASLGVANVVNRAIQDGYGRAATAADHNHWTSIIQRGETDYLRMVDLMRKQVAAHGTVAAAIRSGYLREPAQADYDTWVSRVVSGEHTYATLHDLFTRHRNANYTVLLAIRQGYQREPAQADYDMWVPRVMSGEHNWDTLVNLFIGSYGAHHVVSRAFVDGEGRVAQWNDYQFWVPRVESGEHRYLSLVRLFQQS